MRVITFKSPYSGLEECQLANESDLRDANYIPMWDLLKDFEQLVGPSQNLTRELMSVERGSVSASPVAETTVYWTEGSAVYFVVRSQKSYSECPGEKSEFANRVVAIAADDAVAEFLRKYFLQKEWVDRAELRQEMMKYGSEGFYDGD